ncbi:hypothetical protein VTL71DRAFT_3384 [Oculimacula yallundae]|uniref:Uncharacterized protein n=1 Tax=Oculimacula yallundae TaxID=86028 RepID=A0ABR4C738_9HELO
MRTTKAPTQPYRSRLSSDEIYARQRKYSLGPSTPGSPPFLHAPPSTPASHMNSRFPSSAPSQCSLSTPSPSSTSSFWPGSWGMKIYLSLAFILIAFIIRLGADSEVARAENGNGSEELTSPNPRFRAQGVFGSGAGAESISSAKLTPGQEKYTVTLLGAVGWLFTIWVVVLVVYGLLSLFLALSSDSSDRSDGTGFEDEGEEVEWEDVAFDHQPKERAEVKYQRVVPEGSYIPQEEEEAEEEEEEDEITYPGDAEDSEREGDGGQPRRVFNHMHTDNHTFAYNPAQKNAFLNLNQKQDVRTAAVPARVGRRDFTYHPEQGIAFQKLEVRGAGAGVGAGAGRRAGKGAAGGAVRGIGRDFTYNPGQEIKISDGIGGVRGPLPVLGGRDRKVARPAW